MTKAKSHPASEWSDKGLILDTGGLQRTIKRLAHEIVERNQGLERVCLVGIESKGVHLAQRLQQVLGEIEPPGPPLGRVDITLYRDDLSAGTHHPRLKSTDIPFSIDDRIVVLVDDVLYTGRTIRSALDALMDFGRPSAIQLAVMVDRGHRELPIKADYVGKNVPTSRQERVSVRLKEWAGPDVAEEIWLQEKSGGSR